ncbi:fasciclin domain-containing protein [Mucilaginibacter limnophilus]|uniref:Fasciclin domain-containing protein n=1 Tax=Mucilaginibacter limnophilus TaxID=1932778 RepID=A0A3S2V7S3_9SPHI|nr:fasciclin domain-containing protein [Mucilaginibacter limnophilus]RVU00621.1 fasciclin domain-containing protein [Mucilaginibacter limnophilus]
MSLKVIFGIILFAAWLSTGYAQSAGKSIDGVVMQPTKTAFDNLSANPNFSVFINAINTAGLSGTLSSQTPVTVLAANNKAFAKLPVGLLDTLFKPENKTKLAILVNGHLLAGKITSADIAQRIKNGNGSARLITLAGTSLTAVIDTNRNIVLTDGSGNQSVISRFNAVQSNGIVHTVTSVLMPAVL